MYLRLLSFSSALAFTTCSLASSEPTLKTPTLEPLDLQTFGTGGTQSSLLHTSAASGDKAHLTNRELEGFRKVIEIQGNSSYGLTSAGNIFIHQFNVTQFWTVPLFQFKAPYDSTRAETIELANQAIMGMFALLYLVGTMTVPVLFAKTVPFQARNSPTESFVDRLTKSKSLLNFIEADMVNQIGLDRESCLRKTICQAHRSPEKYGLFAVPFRMFYPPPSDPSDDSSTFRTAAGVGKYTRTNCKKRFKCFFDPLDLVNYAFEVYEKGSIYSSFSAL